MNLHHYDLVIINSSAGKDSLAAIWKIRILAGIQDYPVEKIVVSHQCLGRMEWPGTKELATKQAEHFGMKIYYSERRTAAGENETILDYARRREKWPSNKQRWCTSDFKRGPGARVVTKLTKGMGKCKILYVFGFRAEESPARSKKEMLTRNKRLTTQKREVWEYLPIHHWPTERVWNVIKAFKLPYHKAYDLGMPRLSCVFCIFSPLNALVIAGKHNPELLNEYIDTEKEIGHTFRNNFSLQEVKDKIESGYVPETVDNWVM